MENQFTGETPGTIGVNPDLVEREYNFPRFKLLCPENETETELLERVKKSGETLLNVLETESVYSAHELEETDRKNFCCFPTKKSVYIGKKQEMKTQIQMTMIHIFRTQGRGV